MNPTLTTLPEDVQVELFKYLSAADLCSLSGTCKRFQKIIDDNDLWFERFQRAFGRNKDFSYVTKNEIDVNWKYEYIFEELRYIQIQNQQYRYDNAKTKSKKTTIGTSLLWLLLIPCFSLTALFGRFVSLIPTTIAGLCVAGSIFLKGAAPTQSCIFAVLGAILGCCIGMLYHVIITHIRQGATLNIILEPISEVLAYILNLTMQFFEDQGVLFLVVVLLIFSLHGALWHCIHLIHKNRRFVTTLGLAYIWACFIVANLFQHPLLFAVPVGYTLGGMGAITKKGRYVYFMTKTQRKWTRFLYEPCTAVFYGTYASMLGLVNHMILKYGFHWMYQLLETFYQEYFVPSTHPFQYVMGSLSIAIISKLAGEFIVKTVEWDYMNYEARKGIANDPATTLILSEEFYTLFFFTRTFAGYDCSGMMEAFSVGLQLPLLYIASRLTYFFNQRRIPPPLLPNLG